MSRWGDVVLGGAAALVLLVAVVECVRTAREVLAVERDRRRRGLLVTPPRVGRSGQSVGSLPSHAPGPAFLDDEIARTARRVIAEQDLAE